MVPLRVAAIRYLNTVPLMWDFENPPQHDELKREFSVSYTLPSSCAQALHEGSVDIGIIPIAAYPRIPNLVIVPDVAIAARGAVRSILLVSKKPLEEIQSVALDNSSRTSAALVRVLFHHFYHLAPAFVGAAPDLDRMLAQYDSALLIGDPALRVNRANYHTWDLAEEWAQFTGKPFVFAFWAVRGSSASLQQLRRVVQVFQQSRDAGLKHVPELVQSWSPKIDLPPDMIREYLTRNIHYHLENDFIEGLQLFFRYAFELGILPDNPELRFI